MNLESLERILIYILLPIVFIILIMIVVAAFRVACCNDLPKKMEDLDLTKLKTGDIIGVGYTHPFGWFVKAWSGSVWSHTGIIWEDPITNEIYVLEAAMYTGKYRGVIKIPLVNWIRFNRKSHIGVARLKGKTVDPNELLKAFEKRQSKVKLESYNWRWHRLLYTTPFYEETRTKYTCYEIVVNTLQDVGVIRKIHTSSSYFPYRIMSGDIPLSNGYIIEPAILLDVKEHTRLRQIEDKSYNNRGSCMKFLTSWSSD